MLSPVRTRHVERILFIMAVLSVKALGRRKPLLDDWSVSLPPEFEGDDGVTLRQVIARIVQGEVAAFRQRQADRRLIQVLTSREIAEGAARGKIISGESEVEPQAVETDEAIATAWQAFEDGLYLVAIDGQEQRSLSQQVYLRSDSRITFIRLTLLAGG